MMTLTACTHGAGRMSRCGGGGGAGGVWTTLTTICRQRNASH
jgi:hypothetical protein